MGKRKVLHVILDMGPGGAEQVVLNYMKKMDRSQFEPMICVLWRFFPRELEEVRKTKVKWFHLKKKPGFDLNTLMKLASIIKNENVDLLHLHNFSAVLYGTLAGLISIRPKIIRTEHNVVSSGKSLTSRSKRMFLELLGLFHSDIIAVSDAVRKSQGDHSIGINKKKIIVVYNGIEIKLFSSTETKHDYRSEFGIGENDLVFGKIASMYPQKDHENLFKAVVKVLKKIPNAKFLLVGDGPRRAELEETVRGMGLSKSIIFTGIRNDVPDILKFIDVFVLSSAWEGFPMTILEAMASKKPVVVTDVGGNSEAVKDGVTGFLVKPRDADALADALIKLGEDRDLMKRFGEAAHEVILHSFTSDHMVKHSEALYLKALR